MKLLLHVCCAPCCGGIIETLLEEKCHFAVFFYNPNIYPQEEYFKRKEEVRRFCQKKDVELIDGDYDDQLFFDQVKGFESLPERDLRCDICFRMRLFRTAQMAEKLSFDVISSSLGISRWKDFEQITKLGQEVISQFSNLRYWDRNWRKQGGQERSLVVSKREEFYRQLYCGCLYSMQIRK